MKRYGWVALFLALVVVPVPARASQTTDQLTYQVDADQAFFLERDTLTGGDASDVRDTIDQKYGNGDGTVSADELDRANQGTVAAFDVKKASCFDNFEAVQLDGHVPERLSNIRQVMTGATGSVSSTDPVKEQLEVLFRFPSPSSSSPTASVQFGRTSSVSMAVECYMSGSNDGFRSASATFPGNPVLTLTPYGSASIDKSSVRPTGFQAYWSGTGLRADTTEERQEFWTNEVQLKVEGGADAAPAAPGEAVRDVGAIIGYSTVSVVAVGATLSLTTEYFRYKALKLLFAIPGFSRLEKDEVLEHNKRDQLYQYIKTNPGPSFSDLRRTLELSNGTLVHHLRILEAQEYVKPVRDGFRTRFYVRGPKIVPTSYLTRTQQQILDVIGANPGLTQKQLSQLLGLPRESVSYHAKRLAAQGKVEIRQEGKWRRYFMRAETSAAKLAASGST